MTNVHVLVVDGSHWVREEDYRALEQQLAEARAALREFVDVWDYGDCDWLDADGFIDWSGYRDAADRHAAALKVAREAK